MNKRDLIDAISGRLGDKKTATEAVNAVLDIPAAEVEPPPAFGTSVRTDFIHGMGKVNGKFVILLDVDHVLATEEMDVLVEAQGVGASEAA